MFPGAKPSLDAILQEISGPGFDGGQARVEVGQSSVDDESNVFGRQRN